MLSKFGNKPQLHISKKNAKTGSAKNKYPQDDAYDVAYYLIS